MEVEQMLLKLGIRTYSYPVITEIGAKIEVPLGDSLSTELGWIYGISTEINGVLPKDKNIPLPSLAQAGDLYLVLLNGQTMYVNDQRLSNYIYLDPAATGPINSRRYYPINIPMTTDLKQSFLRNPKQLTGFSTMITFHYIPKDTYLLLVQKGLLQNLDLGIVGK